MNLDKLEQQFVNSPLKKIMQKHFELAIFKGFLGGRTLDHMVLLDAGCGSGYGVKLLHDAFKPAKLVGFDILPDEVSLARQLVQSHNIPATILQRDVVETGLPSDTFDAAFIFTMLHHVPGWRDAMREMHRILVPGGLFFVDELNRGLVHLFARTTGVKHPEEAQFDWPEFRAGLTSAGFKIVGQTIFLRGFGMFMCEKGVTR
jgi:SAM-dependent methyltransferase